MEQLKVIAFTHANVGLENIAKFFIAEDDYATTFAPFTKRLNIHEFMFLATCNRTEFYFCTEQDVNNAFLRKFYSDLYPNWSETDLHWAIEITQVVDGLDAMRHMFHVAGSLDSLVVGEREIITQFRKSYEKFNSLGLTGDLLRIAERKTIETAKRIFTETDIANRPVSVVNLANKSMRDINQETDSTVLVVGAGVTNQAMLKKMKKQGYHDFHIFNRTLSKAETLAKEVGGKAYNLEQLSKFEGKFDILLTCTGAPNQIITKEVYKQLVGDDTARKIVVDLAVPNDFDTEILKEHTLDLIEVESLKEIASRNLEERKKSMSVCEAIVDKSLVEFKEVYHVRQVELAMKEVPQKVKEIKERAVNQVFAKQLESLNSESKEVLDEIIQYMEKKYISVPMKMAREIIIESKK